MKHFPLNPVARTASRAADLGRPLLLRRALAALLLGAAGVMAVSEAPRAFAAEGAPAAASTPTSSSTPRPGGHMGGHMGGHGLPFAGRGFERLLDEVKATDAQRQQIRQIAVKAQGDLQALHQAGRAAHQRGMAVWTSPRLDAGEAETLRQQMLAHHDQVSKRVMQAMLEVGQVLSPEQRAQAARIVEKRQAHRWDKHGARQGDWRGGHHGEHHGMTREPMQPIQPAAERSTAAGAAPANERVRDHMLRRPVAPASAPGSAAPAPAPAASSR